MGPRKYRLPKTHYDLLEQHFPVITKAAREDADTLKSSAETVLQIGAHETQYRAVVERVAEDAIRETADRLGYPFEEFRAASAADPQAAQYLSRLKAHTSMNYQVALNYELSGRRVFYLSENLIDQLAETELKFPADLVRTPFPTSLFVLQGKTARDLLDKMASRASADIGQAHADMPISVYVTVGESSEFPGNRVMVIAAYLADADANLQVTMFKRDLLLKEGWTVEDALKTDWNAERLKAGMDVVEGAGINHTNHGVSPTDASDDFFYSDGLQFYRLIVNGVLYLMSDDSERREMRPTKTELMDAAMKESKARRRRDKEAFAKRFSDTPYILLGETIGSIEDRGPADRGASAKRIIVRGHFKNQAHGQGLTQRKHIWVKPYYRGPEMAELVNKPYLVR